MAERRKHIMKDDYRATSNNRKNEYRNYGQSWEQHRNEDYNGYKYPDLRHYDYRQRRDLTPTGYSAEYRHSSSSTSQDPWRNDADTTLSTTSYYNQTGQYNEDHRNSNYSQHQHLYASHPPYDYLALTTAPHFPQQNNRFSHNNKRRQDSDGYNFVEGNHKAKKKKPLSQNVPTKREWTIDDAKKAINVEMDFSKRFKQNSLMIKFPDIDINKEIVSKFHSSIENVHFQQPSTARYCFVTLNDTADGDLVIKALNATKFGQGFLTAEYKKERDNQIVSPEDLDPLTLYVGNLAQEITKQDLEQIYTKKKRIDIGFAMKMKKTRYAFISFWNVDDSIEAYTRSRSIVLYSKSLIVRFRRLHGTVGLPGEPKSQNPPKSISINNTDLHNGDANSSGDEHTSTNPRSLADRSDDIEENSLSTTCEENLIENIRSNSSLSSHVDDNNDNIRNNASQSSHIDDSSENIITNASTSSHVDDNNKNAPENDPGNEPTTTEEVTVDLSLVKQEQPDDVNYNMEMDLRGQCLKREEIESDVKPPISQFDSPFLPSYVINELNISHRPIKEEGPQSETTIIQHNLTSDETEQQNSGETSRSGNNNLGKDDYLEFEMDMVSSVDFNSIYKSIQAKPAT